MQRRGGGRPRTANLRSRHFPNQPVHKVKQHAIRKHKDGQKVRRKRPKQKVSVHFKQSKHKQQQHHHKSRGRPKAVPSSKRLSRDEQSQSNRDFSEIYMLKPRLSASRRCARWLVGLPKKKKWSTGTTQSTITIEGVRKKHHKPVKKGTKSRKVEKAYSKENPSSSQLHPAAKHVKKMNKNPHVSAKHQASFSQVSYEPTVQDMYTKISEYSCKRPHVRYVSRKVDSYHSGSVKCPEWSNLNYPNQCRQCLKRKWQENRDKMRPSGHYHHHNQHRPSHHVKKHVQKETSSLGWAILQVIKMLGRKRAYPLAILEALKKKWGFPKLNLLELNNALRWMEERRLLFCHIKMNRHYPKFQVDTRGEAVLAKRIRECRKQAALAHNHQRRQRRIGHQSRLPLKLLC